MPVASTLPFPTLFETVCEPSARFYRRKRAVHASPPPNPRSTSKYTEQERLREVKKKIIIMLFEEVDSHIPYYLLIC